MLSKTYTQSAKSASQSTKEREATSAEHRMKRMHEARTKEMAQAIVDGLNVAVRSGKVVR
jgi:hypothetical protein